MRLRITFAAVLLLLFVPMLAFAAFQAEPPVPVDMSWQYFVALLLNSFIIVGAVQLLRFFFPYLKERIPWVLPIIAVSIGPLMAMATTAVSAALGHPVDFSPIAGVFAGGSAVAIHQFGKQVCKIRPPKAA